MLILILITHKQISLPAKQQQWLFWSEVVKAYFETIKGIVRQAIKVRYNNIRAEMVALKFVYVLVISAPFKLRIVLWIQMKVLANTYKPYLLGLR